MKKLKNIMVVGCGAIAQTHHIPLLQKKKVKLYLCDTNKDVVSKKFSKLNFSTNYNDFTDKIDGAFICTNHSSHYPIAYDLLDKKINLLIEKPITISLSECENLIGFEDHLTVGAGYFRRYIDNFINLRKIIRENRLGKIKKILMNEGGVYGWPVMSNSFWKKESAGGGVLIDTGSHSVDLLNFIFDNNIHLVNYEDDAVDGLETNADLKLLSDDVEIDLSLSRNRPMSNTMKIYFDDKFIEFDATNGGVVDKHNDVDFSFSQAEYPDDIFTKQIESWINPNENLGRKIVSASDVKHTVKIIEQCYLLKNG